MSEDSMLEERALNAVMTHRDLYIYEAFNNRFVPRETFVRFIPDHPEYRESLRAGRGKGNGPETNW